jgi:hypothetical protein
MLKQPGFDHELPELGLAFIPCNDRRHERARQHARACDIEEQAEGAGGLLMFSVYRNEQAAGVIQFGNRVEV